MPSSSLKDSEVSHVSSSPKLPSEILLLIWSYLAVATPGVVVIKDKPPGTKNYHRYPTLKRVGGLPLPLQVCYDSRVAALKHYQLLFTKIDGHGVWFDPIRDTLDTHDARKWLRFPHCADLALVQNLITWHLVDPSARAPFFIVLLEDFPNLQRLALPRDSFSLKRFYSSETDYDARARSELEEQCHDPLRIADHVPLLSFLAEEPSVL